MRENPQSVRYADLHKVCKVPPSHRWIARSVQDPVAGDPRVKIPNSNGQAKAYQVRQVLAAIDKLEDT